MSLAKALSAEVTPIAPDNITPATQGLFNRQIIDWVRRIIQRVSSAQFSLPPIPDKTKNYTLVYTASDQTIKWIEWTDSCEEMV